MLKPSRTLKTLPLILGGRLNIFDLLSLLVLFVFASVVCIVFHLPTVTVVYLLKSLSANKHPLINNLTLETYIEYNIAKLKRKMYNSRKTTIVFRLGFARSFIPKEYFYESLSGFIINI